MNDSLYRHTFGWPLLPTRMRMRTSFSSEEEEEEEGEEREAEGGAGEGGVWGVADADE